MANDDDPRSTARTADPEESGDRPSAELFQRWQQTPVEEVHAADAEGLDDEIEAEPVRAPDPARLRRMKAIVGSVLAGALLLLALGAARTFLASTDPADAAAEAVPQGKPPVAAAATEEPREPLAGSSTEPPPASDTAGPPADLGREADPEPKPAGVAAQPPAAQPEQALVDREPQPAPAASASIRPPPKRAAAPQAPSPPDPATSTAGGSQPAPVPEQGASGGTSAPEQSRPRDLPPLKAASPEKGFRPDAL